MEIGSVWQSRDGSKYMLTAISGYQVLIGTQWLDKEFVKQNLICIKQA